MEDGKWAGQEEQQDLMSNECISGYSPDLSHTHDNKSAND